MNSEIEILKEEVKEKEVLIECLLNGIVLLGSHGGEKLMNGWIKLHREMINWEWFSSSKHVHLFIYFLSRANHKDGKYCGELIPMGSFTTSYATVSAATGLGVRKIRTVLKDLNSTGEVTSSSTAKRTMITITNWEKYQIDDTGSDKQTTSKRQTNDRQTTTNKNEKNEKNEKNAEEEKSEASSDSGLKPIALTEIYNSECAIPKKLRPAQFWLTAKEIDQVNILLGHPQLQTKSDWVSYFQTVRDSKFLTTEKKPAVDFQWVINPENASKILAGRYTDTLEKTQHTFTQQDIDEMDDYERKYFGVTK